MGAVTLDPASTPWTDLATDYERARARKDSLDRLAELVGAGATGSVGVDVSDDFLPDPPRGMELLRGDLSDLSAVPGLAGRRFDRILFLQSFGYAREPVAALRTARTMLTDDGFILLTRTQPVPTPSSAPRRTGPRSGRSTSRPNRSTTGTRVVPAQAVVRS